VQRNSCSFLNWLEGGESGFIMYLQAENKRADQSLASSGVCCMSTRRELPRYVWIFNSTRSENWTGLTMETRHLTIYPAEAGLLARAYACRQGIMGRVSWSNTSIQSQHICYVNLYCTNLVSLDQSPFFDETRIVPFEVVSPRIPIHLYRTDPSL
jgi:hypothetical protein